MAVLFSALVHLVVAPLRLMQMVGYSGHSTAAGSYHGRKVAPAHSVLHQQAQESQSRCRQLHLCVPDVTATGQPQQQMELTSQQHKPAAQASSTWSEQAAAQVSSTSQ